MDTSEYVRHGKGMVEYIAQYLQTIRERRVFPDVQPGYMRSLVPCRPPDKGEKWTDIIEDVERVIMPGMTHWQSPRMHAYFPATHSYPSLLGDMLADAINSLGFTWASSPACTELEVIVMDWLAEMIGLPYHFMHSNPQTSGGGVIQTTCSEATFVALLAARSEAIRRMKTSKDCRDLTDSMINAKLVAYCSEQAHSSVEKASLIGLVKLRLLPTDQALSLRGETLRKAIEEDKRQGLVPFYVCATLGTTGSCSFDNLQELGLICSKEMIWLHVDAAYAGSAFICPEFRHFMQGVEHADSFVFNPSKWMLVNFDLTAMWVKRSESLHHTFNVEPLYLQHENSKTAIDYMHWQIPLSRRFRALKLWFVIRSHGVQGLQSHIRSSVEKAAKFEKLVEEDKRFEIPAKRHLGLVVLRLLGKNSRTEKLLKMLNREGKVHMVPASLNGVYVIRFTITSPHTTMDDLTSDWKTIQTAASMLEIDERMPEAQRHDDEVVAAHGKLKRRSTWSDGREKFDITLLLSNVPDHPHVVNGTFAAALCDSKNFTLAPEWDNHMRQSCSSRKKLTSRMRGFSVDSGVQKLQCSTAEFNIRKYSPVNSASSEEEEIIPNNATLVEKQEINGHYGVEG